MRRRDAGRPTDAPGTETPAQCGDGIDNDGDGLSDCGDPDCIATLGCGGGTDAGPRPDGGFSGCTATPYVAMGGIAPVDIVWVIDNSGSMNEEAALIQERMNDFAAAITSSGIDDYHVVVITATGWVDVPAPLGTDPTHFLFVNEDVQSSEPLGDALARLPDYEDFLREEAVLHFVFVTDDESGISATSFRRSMEDRLLREFTANVIASPPGSMHPCTPFCFPGMTAMEGCVGSHGDAAANGDEYWALASATHGLRLSICTENWTRLFDDLTALVAAPTTIPCRFEIPAPPPGETFDRNRVNVVFSAGDGTQTTIPRAPDCASGSGWIYDDETAPRQVILCPSDCALVESDPDGGVDIAFGCATVLI